MTRFISRFFTVALTMLAATSAGAQASDPPSVPDFRYIATRDIDFYGADLDAVFDTTLESCERACSANAQCSAFTFNTRSNACFPKRGVTDRKEYAGAVSAEKIATAPAVLSSAEARAKKLGFLGANDLTDAETRARTIGLRHQGGGLTLDSLLATARARETSGNIAQAMGWTGAAVAATDRADLWTDYARLLIAIKTNNSSERRDNLRRAVQSAANAYLRGETPAIRASALMVMSDALEEVQRGRDMIPALRLAADEQPRGDIDAALEKAVAKYGFRITENTVESDSAAPRICAQFSEPLAKVGVDYEPFVRSDTPGLAVVADGNQLCVDGVEHGQR